MSTDNGTTIWVTKDQKKVFEGVRDALLEENGHLSNGQALEEIARAYPVLRVMAGEEKTNGEFEENGDVPMMCGLVDETAAEVGDPTFTKAQLNAMDSNILRNMAKAASSDTVNGRSTRMEITAYFTCPCPRETDSFPE